MARNSRMWSAIRSKAPKRFNWYPALDTVCGAIVLPPRYCETSPEGETPNVFNVDCQSGEITDIAAPVALRLVEPRAPAAVDNPSPTGLSGDAWESDDITVVKMVGYVALEPYYVADAEALETLSDLSAEAAGAALASQFVAAKILGTPYFLRAGLKKDDWIFDPAGGSTGQNGTYNPPVRDPLATEEWADGRFARFWQREKFGSQKGALFGTIQQNAEQGVCSQVTAPGAGAPANTLSSGSGTVNIPAISTNCSIVANTGVDGSINAGSGVNGVPEGIVKLNLNSRRRFRLRENQGLTLWLNWTSWDIGAAEVTDGACPQLDNVGGRMAVGFRLRAHIKLLLETA